MQLSLNEDLAGLAPCRATAVTIGFENPIVPIASCRNSQKQRDFWWALPATAMRRICVDLTAAAALNDQLRTSPRSFSVSTTRIHAAS